MGAILDAQHINLANLLVMEDCSPIDIGLLGANNLPFGILGPGHDLIFLLRRRSNIGKLFEFEVLHGIVVVVQLSENPLEGGTWKTKVVNEYRSCRARREPGP